MTVDRSRPKCAPIAFHPLIRRPARSSDKPLQFQAAYAEKLLARQSTRRPRLTACDSRAT
jgi:hypothetical protein